MSKYSSGINTCAQYLDFLEEMRGESFNVHAHILFQNLSEIREERIAVLVQLGTVKRQPLLRLPVVTCNETKH